MALKRIMPCLLYDGTGLVKTVRFSKPSYIGDPVNAIKIFNEKEVDELIVLDIMASKEKRSPNFERIADMAAEAFMPFSYGGGVKRYEDFSRLFKLGVEKVIVNSLIQENPGLVREVIADYGGQAVVACIDFKKQFFGTKAPYSHRGYKIGHSLTEYAKYLEREIGVGEIMLQSVDRDGTWEGYEYEEISRVAAAVELPLIAAGGCGTTDHLKKVLYQSGAQAAAVGSMAVYSKKGMGVLINFPAREEVIHE
jgi:imidazole glycerol-phosphate synthase subunit HisF